MPQQDEILERYLAGEITYHEMVVAMDEEMPEEED